MAHENDFDYFTIKSQKEKVAVIVVIILFVKTMDTSATECSPLGTMLTAKPFVSTELTSPGYPNSYSAGLSCEWNISAPLGHIVKLSFSNFELQFHQDRTCLGGDFVELRDGPSLSDDLIKRACFAIGDQEPGHKPYYSSGQHMRIVFKSHHTHSNAKGFNAFYTAVKLVTSCSSSNTAEQNNNIVLTNITGTISSPDFPRKYSSNITCTWIIKLPSTSNTLTLVFDEFKLDSSQSPRCRKNADSIEIFIGVARPDNILGRYCSKRPPPKTIFSPGRKLTVVFKSTEIYLPKGVRFSASYRPLHQSGIFGECLKVNSKNKIHVSAGIGGVITSPQYPQRYPNNMDCVWTINATAGKRLKFVFLGIFDLEWGRDYVEIRDGSTNTSLLLGQFSQEKPDKPVYTSGPQAFVRFKTGIQYLSNTGFYLMYEPVKQACFPRMTSLLASSSHSKTIKSPDFPRPYPEGFTCEWIISAPEGYFVKLHFSQFLLQYKYRPQASCTDGDYVELRDGSSLSEVIKRYCYSGITSDDAKSASIFSTGRVIYVKFESDLHVPNNDGFVVSYIAVKQASTCSSSNTDDQNKNLVLSSFSGRISLQNFPPSGCTWNIKVPGRNSAVELTIPVLDVGLTNDSDCSGHNHVQIFDGFEAKGVSLGFFCSGSRPPTIYTTGQRATIALATTTNKNVNREFVAVYNSISKTGITGVCEGQHHANYITVFSSGGAIVSPKFPRNYPDNMECYWTITVSSGKTIKFQFLGSFGLVEGGCTGFFSNNDYVSIRDGSSTQSKLLGKFCRGKPVDPVFTSGPSAVVEFSSDSGGSYKGFYLIYEAVKVSAVNTGYCSPHKTSRQQFVLSKSSGSISSPDYPNEYVANVECIWVISVSSGQRVELKLEDLDIKYYYTSCNSGYLEVRDGDNSFSALIGKYCGNKMPGTLYSSGSHMWVKFTSYGATKTRGKGFYASFTTVPKETSALSTLTVFPIGIIIAMIVAVIVIVLICCYCRRYQRERNYRSVPYPGAEPMTTLQNRSPRPHPSAPNRTADVPSNLSHPQPSAPSLPTSTTQGQQNSDPLPNYDDLPPPPPYPGVITDQPQYPLPGEQYPWQPSAPKC